MSMQRRMPEVLTCIAKDVQDPTSQIRMTLSGARSSVGGRGFSAGGGFGGYDDYDDWDDDDWWDDDDDDDWYGMDDGFGGLGGGEYRLDGAIVPGASMNKGGSYAVVITQFGRTGDGCNGQSLGPILRTEMLSQPLKGGMGVPMAGAPFPGPYQKYGANFYGSGYGQPQRGGMIGLLSNPAIVGGSASVYSAHISGIHRKDLVGRGVALCRSTSGGYCRGYIPYCCTVGRDSLSAMELFVQNPRNDLDGFDFNDGGIQGFGAPGMPVGLLDEFFNLEAGP